MNRLTNTEYEDYWTSIHNSVHDDLASVFFSDKPFYFNRFFDRIQKFAITKYLIKEGINVTGKTLLDIGCDRKRWLSFFEKKCGSIVTGIDLSEYAIRVCQSNGFRAFRASITQMPFRDNCFDFVSSITVLLHLPYELKEKAIAEISRVLNPGGKAILIEGTWKDPSPHVFGLNISEWERHFNKCGLNLVHKSGHCFNLFRMNLPQYLPFRDFFAIHLDYLLEYGLMNYFYGKQCKIALQHLMVFEK